MAAKHSKTGGRPPSYTHEDLVRAAAILEARKEELEPASLRAVLTEDLGISKGIDTRSLQGAFDAFMARREDERRQRLREALPQETRDAVQVTVAQIELALLDQHGEQYQALRSQASEEVRKLREDLDAYRDRVRDLTRELENAADKLAAQQEQTEVERCAREEAQQALAEEKANNVVLQARLAERDEIVRMLRPAPESAPDAVGSPSPLTTSG
ncbi:hypothetical protein [Tranquillimonas alkanivorans]|uniref:Replication region DNA-binding N-term n=1 Tax=Tranquillimonas alkanivorans TaxID=441119 RepID=A0A1I5VXW9_9RHOB|nr:hypothetical protein [Tranquillimonas alkanivorans]SFQ12280.1 hypothetical protein SAMN04488047_13719 [Tranquillimonas alkanivorans]